jgi:fatty acid desaturase
MDNCEVVEVVEEIILSEHEEPLRNEEPQKDTDNNKKLICIGEYEYDITHFKHPGGNVIYYMTNGQDATNAFEEFHYRSKKAKSVLQSLPKKRIENFRNNTTDTVINRDIAILEDFKVFRQSLELRGFFRPSIPHVICRIIELVCIYAFAVKMIQVNIYISIILFGLFGGRCGWIQHEGGHNSLTGNIKIDKWIQNIFIGFGLLTDGSMWNSMHNKHHATPQKIDHDMDLDTAPLVAFYSDAVYKYKNNFIVRKWLQYQSYSFLPITSGFMVMLFWILYLHPRKIIRDKNFVQAGIVSFAHLSRIGLFMRFGNVSFSMALFYHFLSVYLSGIYLFGQFSLSHTFTPVVQNDENPSWVHYAIEHSVDIEPQNPIVSWVMGYLNCQVIHHLFPSMPQYRGPQVSLELQEFCDKWGIKYTIMNYVDAWHCMFKNLDDIGNPTYIPLKTNEEKSN